jgi:hypothetical protein
MQSWYRTQSHGRLGQAGVSSLLVVAALFVFSPAASAGNVTPHRVRAEMKLSLKQIPSVKGSLPVLKLRNTAPPTAFLNKVAQSMAPGTAGMVPLDQLSFYGQRDIKPPENLVGTVVNDHLAVLEDKALGDGSVFPSLVEKGGITGDGIQAFLDAARKQGERIIAANQLIPNDPTHAVIGAPQPLEIGTADPAGGSTKPAAIMAYMQVQRFVAKYPVDGVGSREMLALDPQLNVSGFERSWQTAAKFKSVRETRSKNAIRSAILRQLGTLKATSGRVLDVKVGYYDGPAQGTTLPAARRHSVSFPYLQPVYKYRAVVQFDNSAGKNAPNVIEGYLSIGKQYDALPMPNSMGGQAPPFDRIPTSRHLLRRAGHAGDPCVGRYVVRNDDPNWVNNANGFWSGISSMWGSSWFSNCQYYWAQQWQYESLKDSRANAMNIVDSEGHGDWWDFTTLRNCCEDVNINGAIPYPGFGGSANGSLDYWLIHSCEVVPSPSDTASWADPWWTIFGGLHAVLGYRTIMYIGDGAGYPFGQQLMLGAPVVSAWLNTVMSLGAYAGHPVWGGPEGAHGIGKLMGRPSAITVTGHSNDTAYNTANLGRAGSLTIFWFPG